MAKRKTEAQDPVVGARVKAIRPMTADEMLREGWATYQGVPMVVELDSGALLYPSRDDEGNGPGVLFGFVQGESSGFRVKGG